MRKKNDFNIQISCFVSFFLVSVNYVVSTFFIFLLSVSDLMEKDVLYSAYISSINVRYISRDYVLMSLMLTSVSHLTQWIPFNSLPARSNVSFYMLNFFSLSRVCQSLSVFRYSFEEYMFLHFFDPFFNHFAPIALCYISAAFRHSYRLNSESKLTKISFATYY